MKKFFNEKHEFIDKIAVGLFLYSMSVLILLGLTFFVKNETIRALLILFPPIFLFCPKIINHVNSWIHRVFRFNR